jgi:hypothetical protein
MTQEQFLSAIESLVRDFSAGKLKDDPKELISALKVAYIRSLESIPSIVEVQSLRGEKKCTCWDDMPWAPHCDDCHAKLLADRAEMHRTVAKWGVEAQLKELSEKATAGPWRWENNEHEPVNSHLWSAKAAKTVLCQKYYGGGMYGLGISDADAAFIVACVNYVRSTLAPTSPAIKPEVPLSREKLALLIDIFAKEAADRVTTPMCPSVNALVKENFIEKFSYLANKFLSISKPVGAEPDYKPAYMAIWEVRERADKLLDGKYLGWNWVHALVDKLEKIEAGAASKSLQSNLKGGE